MYEYRQLTPEQRLEIVEARHERGFPPHSPPHQVTGYSTYLFTATCYEHACHMIAAQRRALLLDELFAAFLEVRIELVAWSVLPNHYHLLANSVEMTVIPRIFQHVHGRLSRAWNADDGQVGRKIWYRYTDRAIRSERHYFTTLNYLHYNAVKHGWARSPYDWEHSSVFWYLEHFGREWLRDLWVSYPVRDYGRGWDEVLGMDEPSANPTGS